MNIFFILAFVLASVYLMVCLLLLKGWNRVPEKKYVQLPVKTKFSVIIPFRNEEKNLPYLFEGLKKLDYPTEYYEIIFVDDSSEDKGSEWLRKKISLENFSNFRLTGIKDSGLKGKKQALTKGIENADYEWIVTTDADVKISPELLNRLNQFIIQKPEAVMISGPVRMRDERSWFLKMQSLELTGLNAIGAALSGLGVPFLSNGANLAFKKSAFFEAGGYSGNENKASGDDVFLTLKFRQLYPGKIFFLKDFAAMVETLPTDNLTDFFHQRVRWLGKTYATGLKNIILPAFVWFYHASMLISVFLALFMPLALKFFMILFSIKLVSELIFLIPALKFYRREFLLRVYPLLALIYVVYISLMPLISLKKNYIWKGRIMH